MGFIKKLDIKGIDDQIEKLNEHIKGYNEIKSLLIQCIDELENKAAKTMKEEIILLYLKLQNVVEVAAILNESGHRVKTNTHAGQRKYDPKDITQTVFYDVENDSKYFKIARLFNKYNSRLITEKELTKQLLVIKYS